MKIKLWLRPLLFALAGALLGLGYYYLIGCAAGTCAITSNPVNAMLYMALMGWLLSGVFRKECTDTCSM